MVPHRNYDLRVGEGEAPIRPVGDERGLLPIPPGDIVGDIIGELLGKGDAALPVVSEVVAEGEPEVAELPFRP